jgi:hypothetical protein
MYESSLDVIESFLGEKLTPEGIRSLAQAPEDQIIHLAYMFDSAWDKWRSTHLSYRSEPDNPLYLADSYRKESVLQKKHYNRLALYFEKIGVPDPVDASISARLMLWAATSMVHPEDLRLEMIRGVERLLDIAPFVRSGAMILVPYDQLITYGEVQALADKSYTEFELQKFDPHTPQGLVARTYYGVTAVAAAASFWPLTGTPELAERMNRETAALQQKVKSKDIVMQHAVARFDLPSALKVPIDDLLRLRASEEAFSEFRRKFGLAMTQAIPIYERDGDFVAQEYLKDQLKPASEACVKAAKTISSTEGFLVPTGSELTATSILWMAKLPVDKTFLATIAGLGIGWLGYSLLQRMSRSNKDARSAAAVYGALLEKSER